MAWPKHGPTNADWWTRAPRDGFYDACVRELPRMSLSFFSSVAFPYIGDANEHRKRKKKQQAELDNVD